ncbi:MAG: hypothetical protein GX536_05890 [Actinobacteria bacterium]|nr:hypothetical protein [Actinomycetota bacterium]
MTDAQTEAQGQIEEIAVAADMPTEASAAGAEATDAESGAGDAWKEVGAQLQTLGAGLATAFSTLWKSDENKRHLREIRSSLEAMVSELGAVIKESTSSPEAKQVKAEAGKAIETVKSAGGRTVQEVRPKLSSALSTTNEELQKLLARMRKAEAASDAAGVPSAEPTGAGDAGSSETAQD